MSNAHEPAAASVRGKVVFCVVGLIFSLIMLTFTLDFSFSSLIPSEAALTQLRRDLKKAEAAWETQEAAGREYDDARKRYQSVVDAAWLESRDGSPDVELPKRINAAAMELQLELQNVSAVRRSRLNDQLSLLQLDINTYATVPTLTMFLTKLRGLTPPVSWEQISIRPEMVQNSDQVFFSGTLRAIGRSEDGGESAPADDRKRGGGERS